MFTNRELFLAVVVLVLGTTLLWGLSDDAEAADREIFGDWIIDAGTTRVVSETIDVRGNVTVNPGGLLQLIDCDLAINSSVAGAFTLEVLSGGEIEAANSKIYGSNARIYIKFGSDATIDGCEISHIYGSGYARGIMCTGGTISLTDTVIRDSNYYGLYVQADTVLTNVTISQIMYSNIYVYNYGAVAPYTLTIDDSALIGSGSVSQYISGIYTYGFTQGEQADIIVRNTLFDNLYRGVYLYATGKVSAVVEDCTFERCASGIYSYSTAGSFTLADNRVANGSGDSSVGIYLRMGSGVTYIMDGNIVDNVHLGYSFAGPFGGSYTTSIGYLKVTNSVQGIQADGRLTLTVHNSTLTGISDTFGSFIANDQSSITVIDTEHTKGSGTVDATSWIKAYTEIEILGAKWKDAQAIIDGFLILENTTQVEVARFNLSHLGAQDVAGWEVDSTGRRTSSYLYPALYIDGHGFRGDRFDIWNPVPQRVELVDDYVPAINVITPLPGAGFSSDTVVANGKYDEVGSGVDMIEYSLDGANYTPLTSWNEGWWSIPLSNVDDGDHDLDLRLRDRAGNVGEIVSVSFIVDTTVPFIDLDPVDELVNTATITISGTTEKLATLNVNGQVLHVEEDGTFMDGLALDEGGNTLLVSVVDRAGNVNTVTLTITLDTIAPELLITSPEDGIWTNARTVYVEGRTESDAVLLVIDSVVTVVDGTFRKMVDLEAGTFNVLVSATDPAGNTETAEIVLNVDWTAPHVTLVEPEEGEVYVRDSTLYMTGDVDDPTIDQVLINDQVVDLINGRFVEQFTILEGTTEFQVIATDAAGNIGTTKVVVIRDLTPPTYDANITALGGQLIYVGGDLYCTAPSVEVNIIISELSILTPGGGTALPAGTNMKVRFDLEEGMNVLEVYIVDIAGNQGQTYRQRVVVDTSEPTITMISPQPGERTKEDVATINGRTEEGAGVTINGESVTLLSGGEFRHIVALVYGRNDFIIEVEDAMGNSDSATVSVLREGEVQPPEVSSTGAAVGGFLAGLIVGVLVAVGFFVAKGRKTEADEKAFRPEPGPLGIQDGYVAPPPPGPDPGPTPPGPEELESWEEY